MPRLAYRHLLGSLSVAAFAIAFAIISVLFAGAISAEPTRLDGTNAIAQPFHTYYWNHQGDRVLGNVQSVLMENDGYGVQYFEKGRLEDHSSQISDPAWHIMTGRLTVEMMEQAPTIAINGTMLTYGELYRATYSRFPPPAGFTGGTMAVEGGVFVPFDAELRPVAGYIVPFYFWDYINRADFFPHGWLHDIGLPLTDVLEVQVMKDGAYRTVKLQAFERTILTYDGQNPPAWQVEQANVGTDMLLAMGHEPLNITPIRPPPTATPVPSPTPPPPQRGGPKRIEVNLTQQRLYAYEGDYLLYDIPVSTGRDDWETPTGSFTIFSKRLEQDMRGDSRGETWYVPDVPHVMYFASGGYAIHGTYWHNAFGTGERRSHGCVNLPLDMAALLYAWADMGTPVIIYY